MYTYLQAFSGYKNIFLTKEKTTLLSSFKVTKLILILQDIKRSCPIKCRCVRKIALFVNVDCQNKQLNDSFKPQKLPYTTDTLGFENNKVCMWS